MDQSENRTVMNLHFSSRLKFVYFFVCLFVFLFVCLCAGCLFSRTLLVDLIVTRFVSSYRNCYLRIISLYFLILSIVYFKTGEDEMTVSGCYTLGSMMTGPYKQAETTCAGSGSTVGFFKDSASAAAFPPAYVN